MRVLEVVTLLRQIFEKFLELCGALEPEFVPQELNYRFSEKFYSIRIIVVLEDAKEKGKH